MTLQEFIKEMKNDLDKFEQFWIKENKKNPEMFPMKFEDNNSGLWFEQFTIYLG